MKGRSFRLVALTILLMAILSFNFVPSVQATEIFSDGFESNDFSAWDSTTGSPTVVTEQKHHGTYAMKADTSAQESAHKAFTQTATAYLRQYVYFSNLPSSGNYLTIMCLWDGANLHAIISIKNDAGTQKWSFRRKVGWADNFGSATPTTGTWYCVEMKLSMSDTTCSWEFWVDGNSQNSGSYTVTSSGPNGIYVGGWDKSEVLTNYVDCVVVADEYIGVEEEGEFTYVLQETFNITADIVMLQEKGFAMSQPFVSSSQVAFGKESGFSFSNIIGSSWGVTAFQERLYGLDATTLVNSVISFSKETVVFAWEIWETLNINDGLVVLQEKLFLGTLTFSTTAISVFGKETGIIIVEIWETFSITDLLQRIFGLPIAIEEIVTTYYGLAFMALAIALSALAIALKRSPKPEYME